MVEEAGVGVGLGVVMVSTRQRLITMSNIVHVSSESELFDETTAIPNLTGPFGRTS